MSFLKDYGNSEGPLGFPMMDKQARALAILLKALPPGKDYAYRKAVLSRSPTELNPGERSDVSWISTESVDRVNEVVVARGMNDAQFAQNPLVTLQHFYGVPPVGRSLWRKRVKDGDLVGIKAKTQYPPRPNDWPEKQPWSPDQAFALVQSGLMNGKSIGFLPTRVHVPDDRERKKNGWESVELVIDEWLLLEYACVYVPCNQDSLVEEVSKSLLTAEQIEWLDNVFPALLTVKGAVPYQETPKAPEDRPWDASAARARLKEWAGGDHWDPKKYRQGFAYVANDGKDLDDYKLPHHDIIDGKLHVVWHGVRSAMAALGGARGDMGLSDKDEAAVRSHLEKHYTQFDKEPPRQASQVIIPFTPFHEIEKAVQRQITDLNFEKLAEDAWNKARGRI